MLTTPHLAGSSVAAWTYQHDILGNRTRRNATAFHSHPMRYDWDVLNRALLIAQPSGGASYAYRADGQRIEKVAGVTFSWSGPRTSGHYDTNYAQNRPSSRYYYDGQMGFEDDYNPSGTVTKVTRNLLGARGIDRISITENSATTHGYSPSPRVIVSRGGGWGVGYGHGNCRGILTKNGTSYGTGNWRTYDVWGSVRSGSTTGDPKSRYVASIGHVADDESSLIYMRARYYEPATGRFISEDPAKDGPNWYVYCGNEPVGRKDLDGKKWAAVAGIGFGLFTFFLFMSSFDADGSLLQKAAHFASAVFLGAVTYTLNGPPGLAWAMRAAQDFLKVMSAANGVDWVRDVGEKTRGFARASLVVAFYFGYGAFLFFAFRALDEWVQSL